MSSLAVMMAAVTLASSPQTAGPSPNGLGATTSLQPGSAGLQPIASPAGRLDALLEGIGLELEVNNDKPKVTLAFGRRLQPSITTSGDDNLTAHFSQVSWNASVSAPIGGKDDLTDPQTLDRLSNGSTLTLGVSRFSFSNRDVGDRPAQTGAWQLGGEATVGFNRFDYRDAVTLAERTDDETAYAIGAFIAYYPSDARSLVSAGARYQYAFDAQDETILCKAVVAVPADDCVNAPPGPPDQTDGVVLDVEYRRTFDIGWSFGDIAISPMTTYDTGSDEFGVELPIYLLPSASSPILPGIKVGYTTETSETTFGIFIKSSFSLSR